MARIPALDGVDRLVGTLDALCADPIDARHLPVIIVDDEDPESAAAQVESFVLGYRARLLDNARSGLLPSALVDGTLLAAVAKAPEPDVDLLQRLGKGWQDTMPRSGGRLKLTTHRICNDVLTAPVGIGQANRQRDDLVDHLVAAWQRRTPGLRMLQSLLDSDNSGGFTHLLVRLLSVLIGEPLKWFYAIRLDRTKRLRWYTEQVSRAGQPSRGFLSAAVNLGQHGILRDNVALRQKLLIEALGLDLIRASRRGLMSPSRRRRVWSFVLLLQEIGDLEGPARRMLDGWTELKTRLPDLPVVIVAGHAGPFTRPDDAGREPRTPRRATEELQFLINAPRRKVSARRPESQLVVRLPEGPELIAVRDWLETNVEARPRTVGWPSAYLGWLLVVALMVAVGAGGVLARQRWLTKPAAPCAGWEWSASGEQVGIDTVASRCLFNTADARSQVDQVQGQIRMQNAAAMAAATRAPHLPVRTVVFIAPLTCNPNDSLCVLPTAVLQLQGAADAQKAFNNAPPGLHQFRIVVRVANVGEDFDQGVPVVAKLKQLAAQDKSIVAVIGIGESKQVAIDALKGLGSSLALIGASTTGGFMPAALNGDYFGTQPPNMEIAQAMADVVKGREHPQGTPMRAMIIKDDGDGYSEELSRDLVKALDKLGVKRVQQPFPYDAETPAEAARVSQNLPTLAADIVKLNSQHGLSIYLGRSDQLPKLLQAVNNQANANAAAVQNAIPILAGDAVTTLVESRETPPNYRVGAFAHVKLTYVAFAGAGSSEEAAGADAFDTAAAAIGKALAIADKVSDVSAISVLGALRESDVVVQPGAGREEFVISKTAHVPVDRGNLYFCSPKSIGIGGTDCEQSPGRAAE